MKPLHQIQEDRHDCEVPGCTTNEGYMGVVITWDHCLFGKSNRKGKGDFTKFVNNHFNMLRACYVCNCITHESDRWTTKQWLIDYHLDGNYRKEFLEWIRNRPPKFAPNDLFRIMTYIVGELTIEERTEK